MDSRFDRIMHGVGLPALFAAFGEPATVNRVAGGQESVPVMLRQRFTPEEIESLHVGIGDAVLEFRVTDLTDLKKGDTAVVNSLTWTIQRIIAKDDFTVTYLARRL